MLSKPSSSDKEGGKRYSVLTSISFTSEPDLFFFRFYWPLVFLFFFLEIISTCLLKIPFSVVCLSLTALQNSFFTLVSIQPTGGNNCQSPKKSLGGWRAKCPKATTTALPLLCGGLHSVTPCRCSQVPFSVLHLNWGSAPSWGSPQLPGARAACKGICSGWSHCLWSRLQCESSDRVVGRLMTQFRTGPHRVSPGAGMGTWVSEQTSGLASSSSFSSVCTLRPGSPPLLAPRAPGARESSSPRGDSTWSRVTGTREPMGAFQVTRVPSGDRRLTLWP